MDYDELLELLDIEDPSEFKYFEHFADLMECNERISYDTLFELISGADKAELSELIENYFDEISESLPDGDTEAFTFLKTLSLSLRGMIKPLPEEDESERDLNAFVEEMEKFRNWYIRDSNIKCTKKKDGTVKEVTFFEALLLARLEKLNEEEYSYGFDDGIEYTIDEYVVSFSDIMVEDEESIEEDEDGYSEKYFEED